MLKSYKGYKRNRSKKIALKTLIFVTALSIIAAISTIGVAIAKEKVVDPNIVNEYTQTQEYQEVLNNDYKAILAVAEEKGIDETRESLEKLNTIEYKTEKLLSSGNEAYIEKYKKNDNLSKTFGAVGAGLLCAAAVASVATIMIKDSFERSREE